MCRDRCSQQSWKSALIHVSFDYITVYAVSNNTAVSCSCSINTRNVLSNAPNSHFLVMLEPLMMTDDMRLQE